MSDSPIPAFLRAVDALDLEAVMALFAPAAVLAMPFGQEAMGESRSAASYGSSSLSCGLRSMI